MAAGVAMPEIKTAGPSAGVLDKKEVSFETNIRPEDKVGYVQIESHDSAHGGLFVPAFFVSALAA